MKEKDVELKQLIKEAVLEALMEFANQSVAVMTEGEPEVPEPDNEGDGNSTPEDPNSGNNSGSGSGNGTTRPDPMTGMGAFSLR